MSRAVTPSATSPQTGERTHKEILEVLLGLLSMMFVAMVSTTIVSTALPTIIGDLEGSQTQYTWVVTSSLLAMTVSTPIWSKLADLFDKKRMIMVAGTVFLTGSLAAGLVQNVPQLLGARAIQGLGMGGLVALAQAIMGSIIPPRQRGRYTGYMASTMAVATVSGPLIGGLLVDTLGWRWCFWVAVPFTALGMTLVHRFLHLQTIRRKVRIDWVGALVIAIAAALPLIWVSFVGQDFQWLSVETAILLGATAVAVTCAVLWERRHVEPVVPPRVIADRTTLLAIVASIAVGLAQFGTAVFLAQYFQVAQGFSPTAAGLLMLPMILGNMIGATASGQFITRTGVWRPVLLLGTVLLMIGLGLAGTIDHTTPVWHLSGYMVLMGLGVGSLMQNLVLVVQNTVDVTDVGAASGSVTFFRSLGGSIGISVLGAVLAARVESRIATDLAQAGMQPPAESGSNLDFAAMSSAVESIVRTAYADATGYIFLIGAAVTIVATIAVWFMPAAELRTTVAKKAEADA